MIVRQSMIDESERRFTGQPIRTALPESALPALLAKCSSRLEQALDLGHRLAVLTTIGEHAKCQRLDLGASIRRCRTIGHDAGQLLDLGDPAAASSCSSITKSGLAIITQPKTHFWLIRTAHATGGSLAFKISPTACGFALPPVAFITWPVNQPITLGFFW